MNPRWIARLALAVIASLAAVAARPDWQALPGRAPVPAGNPMSPAKVALGERLFFDPSLSRDGTVACASCHDAKTGADGRAVAVGVGGRQGSRNAPTVRNAAFQARLFWDGRAGSLEEQAKGPLTNPMEMAMPDLAAVERRVAARPAYQEAFRRVFGGPRPVSIANIAAAIAAYERTLIDTDTPYDRYVRGDAAALDAAQRRGMALFESYGCRICHSGPNFSGASLFDTANPYRAFPALPMFADPFVLRYRLTQDPGRAEPGSRQGLWRVPSLRNVARTAPYFHNGSVTRLEDAVRIMASAQLGRPADPGNRHAVPEGDVADLVAFLKALSGRGR
jgi:cytochrome c peroxidase